jgi:hypothetical protein
MVTLSTAAGSGSSFTGWSGGGCSGTWTCTVTMTSDQSVTATFATNRPPSGSYSGATRQGSGASFYVKADSTELQDVSIPTVGIGCTPTKSFQDQFNVGSIPIAADGSFASTTTQSGVLSGTTAMFTHTFSGHFHGTSSSGAKRVAGQFREDITFNNGTAYSCTSNDQSWSATGP